MVVKLCPCWEYSCRRGTIFACVWKSPREMDILNMFPQVSPIIASFSTEGTSVSPWTTLGRLLYIVVKLLVPCKEQAWKSPQSLIRMYFKKMKLSLFPIANTCPTREELSKGIKAFVRRCDVVIKFGACTKDWRAIFALIWKDSIKMSIFHVFS